MFELIGYILSSIVGISLGLIGGGGSILTVPILVYVFRIAPELATAYSLFIVGLTALVGSWSYYRNKLISVKTALIFSAPSLAAVFLTRRYLMPAIPQTMSVAGFAFTKDMLIMVVFAVLMVAAAGSMIRKKKKIKPEEHPEYVFNFPLIFIEGAVVGVLTGFVGAGGGFLIIPALVLFAGLKMKEAVGTSLLIIGIKSLLGFSGDIAAGVDMNWTFLLAISAFTVSGIFVGSALAKRVPGEKLKPAFGWFVLIMGVYILIKESLR